VGPEPGVLLGWRLGRARYAPFCPNSFRHRSWIPNPGCLPLYPSTSATAHSCRSTVSERPTASTITGRVTHRAFDVGSISPLRVALTLPTRQRRFDTHRDLAAWWRDHLDEGKNGGNLYCSVTARRDRRSPSLPRWTRGTLPPL
jgi:hypothetical protein